MKIRVRSWWSVAAGISLVALAACDGEKTVGPSSVTASSSATGGNPKAPSNAAAAAVNESRINVSWQDNAPNETGYEIWRSSAGPTGTFSPIATTVANVTTYGDASLSPLTQYCYRIRAYRTTSGKWSYSDFSNTACATTPAPPVPSAPSATSGVPGSSSTVNVTWKDNSSNEDGFRVERSLDGGTSWTAGTTTAANVIAWDDAGRTSEQPVCYRAVAFNLGGNSGPSNISCTTPPGTPSGLSATAAKESAAIDLTWTDNSAAEDGYEVQRLSAGAAWSVVATLQANATTYRDDGLVSDTRYWYQVRATKDGGYSDYSNSATAFVASAPPSAPSGFDVYPSSSSGVAMYWTDNSANEEGFRVERGPSSTGPWETAGTAGPDYPYFNDEGLTAEQQVCYQVIAFNSKGDSGPSNADCTTPPAAPTNLIATTVDDQSISLTWSDNSGIEDGYRVFRYTWFCNDWDCWSDYVPIDLEAGATGLLDTGLTSGTSYWYYVMAIKDGGSSDWSNEADAVTDSPPGTNAITVTRLPPSAAVMRAQVAHDKARMFRRPTAKTKLAP